MPRMQTLRVEWSSLSIRHARRHQIRSQNHFSARSITTARWRMSGPAPQSPLKQAGIGAAIGIGFFIAGLVQSPNPIPQWTSLVFQMAGAALGGIVLYLAARLVWSWLNKR